MADLATAYLKLVPSLKGAKGTIEKELGGISGKGAGSKIGSEMSAEAGRSFDAGGIGNKLASGVSTFGKAAAAGVATAGAAVVALGKQALDSYKDFEQLSGGVETMFKGSSDAVMSNAQRAFATAGMSANEYMENVTGFSASLIQSLGGDTEKAAAYADRAIVDMSDNANKMGTSMESITNAYQGFAKGNYTMLDNLKLGYGGTQEEMKRLISDASKMTDVQKELGVTVDSSSMSFDNVVNAISVMQKSMGIAGTTSEEAMKTIEGSVNMTKAAWANFVTELGKEDGDIGARLDELAMAAGAAMDNILPRIEIIATKIGEMLPQMVPRLLEFGGRILTAIGKGLMATMPTLLQSLGTALGQVMAEISGKAPEAMAAAQQMLGGMGDGMLASVPQMLTNLTTMLQGLLDGLLATLPTVTQFLLTFLQQAISALMESIPILAQSILGMVSSIFTYLVEQMPTIIGGLGAIVQQIIEGLATYLPVLLEYVSGALLQLVETVKANFPQIMTAVGEAVNGIVTTLAENAPTMLSAALDFFSNMLKGIVDSLPSIIEGLVNLLGQLIDTVVENAPAFLAAAIDFILGLLKSILENLPDIIAALVQGLVQLIGKVIEKAPDMLAAAVQLIGQLIAGIAGAAGELLSAIGGLIMDGISHVGDFVGDMLQAGADLVQGLIDGIAGSIGGVADAIMGGIGDAVQGAKDFLGIASPSKLFSWIGKMSMVGGAEGIDKSARLMERSVRNAMDDVYGAASGGIGAVGALPSALAPDGGSPAGSSELLALLQALLNKQGDVYLDGRPVGRVLAPYVDAEFAKDARRATYA